MAVNATFDAPSKSHGNDLSALAKFFKDMKQQQKKGAGGSTSTRSGGLSELKLGGSNPKLKKGSRGSMKKLAIRSSSSGSFSKRSNSSGSSFGSKSSFSKSKVGSAGVKNATFNFEMSPKKVADIAKMDPEKMMHRLQDMMKKSAQTQRALQQWDKKNGLPKSHSQTMVNSSRSRKQLQDGIILPKWDGTPLISQETELGKPKPRTLKKKVDENDMEHRISEPTTSTTVC